MHHPVFDCSFQKWMVRKPGPFYHMIDVSVYLGRQRGEMSLHGRKNAFHETVLPFEPGKCDECDACACFIM